MNVKLAQRPYLRFAASSVFANLTPAARQAILGLVTIRLHSQNDLIYLQGDSADYLYLVLDGYVRLSNIMDDGSVVLARIVAPGEVFGDLPVLDGEPHQDTATAHNKVRLAQMPISRFRRSMQDHPEIAHTMETHVAKRVREFIDVMCTQFLSSLAARLAQVILRLLDSVGERSAPEDTEPTAIVPVISQSDLGCMARGTRGNINKILKEWERNGWISISNRRIVSVDRDRLTEVVHDG